MSCREVEATHLDNVQFQDHRDGGTDLVFESMHFKAIALENEFGTRDVGNPLQDRGHLRWINSGRWHEDVEMDRKQPKGRHVKLASLHSHRVSMQLLGRSTIKGYQLHDGADRPLDMNAIVAEHADQAGLTADGGEIDECPIVFHESLEVVSSVRQHPV